MIILHLNDDNISVDGKFASFYEGVSNLVDKHVFSKKMTHKEVKLQSKPWINFKIVKLRKYRDRLEKE